jgi:hypothetical protein
MNKECQSRIAYSVADPDPGCSALLTLRSGKEKIQIWDPGSGINSPDYISESFVSIF